MKTKNQTASSRPRRSRANAPEPDQKIANVVLPGEDAEVYAKYKQAWYDECQPVGDAECRLVEAIIDTCWRLRRCSALAISLINTPHDSESELLLALERIAYYEEKVSREFMKNVETLQAMQKTREQRQQRPNRDYAFWIDQIDPSKPVN